MSSLLISSFYITYVLLMTTGTITFIEAVSTSNPAIRHIMNLETCISIVAAFFYSKFIEMVKDPQKTLSDVENMRYLDWMITTPMMLLVLMLVLAYNNKQTVRVGIYLLVLLLNWGMLAIGYWGIQHPAMKKIACVLGFVCFIALVGTIWYTYMRHSGLENWIIFSIFVVLWSAYGVVYLAEKQQIEHIGNNILDLFAKCFVGIGFWVYLTRILRP